LERTGDVLPTVAPTYYPTSTSFECLGNTLEFGNIYGNRGYCSPNKKWGFYFQANECRLVVCGPGYPGDVECTRILAKTPEVEQCGGDNPSRGPFSLLDLNGDLMAFAEDDEGEMSAVYVLSRDGGLGSAFNNLPFTGDLGQLELFDNGYITITVGKEMVWYYGSSVPSTSPSKRPTPKPVFKPYQTGLWTSKMKLGGLKTRLSDFQIRKYLEVTKTNMEVRLARPGYEGLVGATFHRLTMSKPKQKFKKKKDSLMIFNLRFFYLEKPDESNLLKLIKYMFRDATLVNVYKNKLKQATPVYNAVTSITYKRKSVE